MKPVVFCLPLFVIALGVQGCATRLPAKLTLAHDVIVPKEFRAGNFSEEHPGYWQGNSAIERYVNAYERGWIDCVQQYADNIDLDDPSVFGNGWVEEASGFAAGYADARARIQLLIRTFGKQKVSTYMQGFRPEFPDEK